MSEDIPCLIFDSHESIPDDLLDVLVRMGANRIHVGAEGLTEDIMLRAAEHGTDRLDIAPSDDAQGTVRIEQASVEEKNKGRVDEASTDVNTEDPWTEMDLEEVSVNIENIASELPEVGPNPREALQNQIHEALAEAKLDGARRMKRIVYERVRGSRPRIARRVQNHVDPRDVLDDEVSTDA